MALALQGTLANLFAGFYITIARQIRVGNYVRLDSGEEGYLVDIAWRSARIRMLPNNIVLVPNSKLAQAIVTNYDLPEKEMAVLVNVGVDYSSDLHLWNGSPARWQGTCCSTRRAFVDQYLVKHEFVKSLHERYAAEGITIPFPIRTIVSREEPDGRGHAAA